MEPEYREALPADPDDPVSEYTTEQVVPIVAASPLPPQESPPSQPNQPPFGSDVGVDPNEVEMESGEVSGVSPAPKSSVQNPMMTGQRIRKKPVRYSAEPEPKMRDGAKKGPAKGPAKGLAKGLAKNCLSLF